MKFSVSWGPVAERELAEAWLSASDRVAVVRAASKIDEMLRRKPLSAGESRESSVSRIALVPPLAVSFEVIVDDEKVFVTGVGLTDRPRQ